MQCALMLPYFEFLLFQEEMMYKTLLFTNQKEYVETVQFSRYCHKKLY
jgi:hypothetical protein